MKNYIKLMRPKHYIKNLILFLPIFFNGSITNIQKLLSVIGGFCAFCLISSVVYIINDICDAENDRKHPTKCNRPIASGKIRKPSAIVFAVLLFACAMAINWFVCKTNILAWVLTVGYIALNLGYSLGLKNVVLADILILVSGYLIRLIYGSAITDIPVSNWLYLTVMAFSFYMGLGKRRGELGGSGGTTRKVLKFHNRSFLDKNMYMTLGLGIVFYSLWCVDSGTVAMYSDKIIFTIPLVVIICMKYSLTLEGDSDGDPISVIFHDKWLMALALFYAALILFIIYIF